MKLNSKNLKRAPLSVCLLFLGIFCYTNLTAQDQKVVPKSSNWTLVSSKDGIKIFSRYQDCRIPSEGLYAEYVLLKLENTNSYPVEISWYNDTYYNGQCTNCDHSSTDRKRSLQLDPKSSFTGECGVGLNNGTHIHSKWLELPNKRILEKVEISEFTVKPLPEK